MGIDDKCPDCGRTKAFNATAAAEGKCPKWWAINDASADDDCRKHAAHRTNDGEWEGNQLRIYGDLYEIGQMSPNVWQAYVNGTQLGQWKPTAGEVKAIAAGEAARRLAARAVEAEHGELHAAKPVPKIIRDVTMSHVAQDGKLYVRVLYSDQTVRTCELGALCRAMGVDRIADLSELQGKVQRPTVAKKSSWPMYQLAEVVSMSHTETLPSKPWFIVETYLTSDGPRTRICDGKWATRAEAEDVLFAKEAKL